MHVLQRIAVIADDKDMAFRTVKDRLESELGNDEYSSNAWFDWFVTGGGRWNPNEGSQYNDDDQSMTISYDEEPKKFLDTVNEAIEARVQEFNNYRRSFNDKNVNLDEHLSSYSGHFDYSFQLYELGKMIDMLQGKWDFNSYFFDVHHDSVNTKHMLDSIDKGVKNWYIVFVDFHF
jgi:hypothetical protein